MRKFVIISSGVLAVAVISAAVGTVLVLRARDQAPEPVSSTDGQGVTLDTSTNTADHSATPIDTSANPAVSASGSNLDAGKSDVKVATPTPSSSPASDDFSQYEQYRTAQGPMFRDITVGTGAEVTSTSKVAVNYRGWLTTGQLFDESYTKGKPLVFTVGQHNVIAGFEEGVMGMKVGGKRRLVIPPSLGYGDQVQGSIPANSVLVFDVEALEVQ